MYLTGRFDGIEQTMGSLLTSTYWVPSELAARWPTIPARLGYAVDQAPTALVRRYWEARAAGEERRINSGHGENKRIDPALIEKVISLDRSVSIVTGGTVINATVCQDLLQLYDSTLSWWINMCPLAAAIDYSYDRYGSYVEYRPSHSKLVMETLALALLVSGGESAFQKPIEMGFGWVRSRYCGAARMLSCPTELATEWPATLRHPTLKCRLTPLCPTPHPSKERYVCGSIRKWFGGVRIISGPALGPSRWEDAAFLAVEPYGRSRSNSLADKLADRAVAYGARLLYTPSASPSRGSVDPGTFR